MNETCFLHVTGAEVESAITPREYNRLLSFPRDRQLEGELLDRAQRAREWYAQNGRPFVAVRRIGLRDVSADAIVLSNDVTLHSLVLSQRLKASEAHALIVLAASAGVEVAKEVARHWTEERPDEAYFLDRLAVAITEHLIFWASATLCRHFEPAQETVLPHLSPGCGHWDLSDQHKLMALLSENGTTLGPLELLPSGAIHPQHSIIAAMGITHGNLGVTPESLCRACDWTPCKFRRAPYSGEALHLLEIR